MIIESGPIGITATSSMSTIIPTISVQVTDSTRPTVISDVFDAMSFNWVVEPAGNGNFETTSLL